MFFASLFFFLIRPLKHYGNDRRSFPKDKQTQLPFRSRGKLFQLKVTGSQDSSFTLQNETNSSFSSLLDIKSASNLDINCASKPIKEE